MNLTTILLTSVALLPAALGTTTTTITETSTTQIGETTTTAPFSDGTTITDRLDPTTTPSPDGTTITDVLDPTTTPSLDGTTITYVLDPTTTVLDGTTIIDVLDAPSATPPPSTPPPQKPNTSTIDPDKFFPIRDTLSRKYFTVPGGAEMYRDMNAAAVTYVFTQTAVPPAGVTLATITEAPGFPAFSAGLVSMLISIAKKDTRVPDEIMASVLRDLEDNLPRTAKPQGTAGLNSTGDTETETVTATKTVSLARTKTALPTNGIGSVQGVGMRRVVAAAAVVWGMVGV